MVKAGIASGFEFLWRDSGIEVPFNLTGYKPSDTILALLWTGIVNTLLVSVVSVVVATVSASPSACCGCRATGCCRPWPASISSSSATSRCCSSCCSGTSACSPRCRRRTKASSFLGVAFLNRRGLSIPLPNELTGFRLAAAGDRWSLIAVQSGSPAGPRRGRRGPASDFPTWLVGLRAVRRAAGRWPCARGGRCDELGRADAARLQLSRRLRAGAGVRGAVRGAVDLHRRLHRRGRARRHPVGAPGPDRRRARRSACTPRPDRAAGGDPAGDAGDHPADHQPVSQPDQELLVRRRHRLSRDRRVFMGSALVAHRPGDRDHRHHARRLPDHRPRRVGVHELVQCPPSRW